jgi:hypothetical protein
MSNNPLLDSRLDSVFDVIAGLRRQMLNTEDSTGQQRIWEVIKNYQNQDSSWRSIHTEILRYMHKHFYYFRFKHMRIGLI